MEKNSCNLKFKGPAFKVYLYMMPLGLKERLGSVGILPAPHTSAYLNYEGRTVQGDCCCYGTSEREAAPKVLPKQKPEQASAASVRDQKLGSCHSHITWSPKSR